MDSSGLCSDYTEPENSFKGGPMVRQILYPLTVISLLAGLIVSTRVAEAQETDRLYDELRDRVPTTAELRLLPQFCKTHPNLDGAGSYAAKEANSPERE